MGVRYIRKIQITRPRVAQPLYAPALFGLKTYFDLKFDVWRSPSPSGADFEVLSLGPPVDGGHGPCDSDTQEDVDSVGASYVAHRVVGVVILNGGDFTGEGVWKGEWGQDQRVGKGQEMSNRERRDFFRR